MERQIASIHIDYNNAPNFFSDKLPRELAGRIAPEEFSRRIAILNQELGKQRSLRDFKMVLHFYMWWLSGFFSIVAISAFIVFGLYAKSGNTSPLMRSVTIGVVIVCFLGLMVTTAPFYMYMNPPPVLPADSVVEKIVKGWSDLDADCSLRWVSKRNTRMHYRRTLSPWTIDVLEVELPSSIEVATELPPTYSAPGTASQPHANS
ncbi:hypothetical protein HDU96_005595 [Phlyctochytrium bullatum]|nr:hypothetical protein HDU96_005595 [Phlyctochytrium bullatum]